MPINRSNTRYESNYSLSYGIPNYKTSQNNRYDIPNKTNINYIETNKSIPYIPQSSGVGVDLSISYKNFEIDEDYKNMHKKMYGNDLKSQMLEKERKKVEDKLRKALEDKKEEERVRKEMEFLSAKARIEEMKRLEELEGYKKDNQRIMNSYSVMSKPKSVIKEIVKNEDDLGKSERIRIELENKRKLDFEVFNNHIQNNLEKIRTGLINQQNTIFKHLNEIKNENMHANFYKLDLHRSVSRPSRRIQEKKNSRKFPKGLFI